MVLESLKSNIMHSKEIVREMYIFKNQLEVIKKLETESNAVIENKEKNLLNNVIKSLSAQLGILNKSIPNLIKNISFFQELPEDKTIGRKKFEGIKPVKKLVQVKYKPSAEESKIMLTISEEDKNRFLENLSKSNLSIHQLKKKYSIDTPVGAGRGFGKPHFYAKSANKFFRNFSNGLIEKGYFDQLNKDLRKMSSPFVVNTYVSMIFFTVLLSVFASIFVFTLLLFYHISFIFPFLSPVEGSILSRLLSVFWVIIIIPLLTGLVMYVYPSTESKSFGARINQELPFVAIHMAAISTAGVDPLKIFEIILKSEEYKFTITEFKKLMNLINFQGYDLITALKKTALSSPSSKLKELFNGLATTITSGGKINDFLSKHSESLLLDYRLEREKYTKISETFMDIYISVVIAAPMILLILFVIMGSTGLGGFDVNIMGFLIILIISLLNVGFLTFLRLKQPIF